MKQVSTKKFNRMARRYGGAHVVDSVVWLGKRGFHGTYIADLTGLSREQVYHISRVFGFSLKDYRNGDTNEARQVVRINPYAMVRTAGRLRRVA